MRTLRIFISLAAIASVLAAAGCDRHKIVPDQNVNYGFLQDCIWTPSVVSDDQGAIPEPTMNGENPIYFTSQKMVITSYNGKKYSYITHFDYKADDNSNAITFASSQANYYFTIHSLSATHLTLFYNGDSRRYVAFTRGDFPESDQIDKRSFPDGWFQ